MALKLFITSILLFAVSFAFAGLVKFFADEIVHTEKGAKILQVFALIVSIILVFSFLGAIVFGAVSIIQWIW